MCEEVEVILPATPRSVPDGRRFVARTLANWGIDGEPSTRELLDDVLLITSELLTNAIQASSESVVLSLAAHHDHVHVEVLDQSPEPAKATSLDPIGSTSKRGLPIVAALSRQWGQSAFNGYTKSVWADIPARARAPFGVHCTLGTP